MAFFSTKTYGHDQGLSCAFRQWRATHSRCHLIHGYSLAFKFTFGCDVLDDRRWCVDFGGLKELKTFLVENFDHKTVIAADDPQLEHFKLSNKLGVLDLLIMPDVGCEKFAEYAFNMAE